MSIPDRLRWLHISSVWVYRFLTWTVLAAGLVFAAAVLSLRYWFLPHIGQYRADIERAVSQAARQRISIGNITANWDGMRPELVFENVTVYARDGTPALELSRIDNTLSWLSLATLEPRFHSLQIYRPVLNVRRDSRGVISIAGIEVQRAPETGEGVADWLLRQRRIVVRDAEISWQDELRGAPPLDLKQVMLRIENRGARHRFGLRAVPPPLLAGPIDVRGELRGDTVRTVFDWDGKLYAQLDYVDIAAWQRWVPFPIEFPQGAGALRLWLGFSRQRLSELTADVRLSDVKTRLAGELPWLDLSSLSGRVAWKASDRSIELSTARLGLTTQGGLTLAPADFLLRLATDRDGKPVRGEMRANAFDLRPLVALADRLPLDSGLRKRLVELDPRGRLYDMVVRWDGDWRGPAHYSARARFEDLAMNTFGKFPGFSGISGNIDGTDVAGALNFNVGTARVDMPLVFREPLKFSSFTGQIGWARVGADIEFRLNSISFANPHLAGTLFGSYRAMPGSRGLIDVTGNLTRADAHYVSGYLPLVIGKTERDWMERAFVAGESDSVSLRLKGNLDDFPFPDNRSGVFQVVAKVSGGVLDYAEGWPRIENIAGEVQFRGQRMEVTASRGTILGATLGNIRAEIPDLKSTAEMLNVSGEATGPTAEFLSFIDKSPVAGMIDRFTEGIRAQGNGKLTLKLGLPLRSVADSKVAGSYAFADNTIVFDSKMPALERASGQIGFTESSVQVSGARGVFLGGPVSITATSQGDSTVRVSLQGSANVDNLRPAAGAPAWMRALSGSTDWQGSIVLRNKLADLTVESNLQGIASDLPPPFAKRAAEAVPLRLERKYTGPQQDQIAMSYGSVLDVSLRRRLDKDRSVIERGDIRLGGGAPEPAHEGVFVSGTLQTLDFDRWRALLDKGAGDMGSALSGIDLKVAHLDAFSRRFHDVSINGTLQGGIWRSKIGGREFEGSVTWQDEGQGKLTARLRKLVIPPVTGAQDQGGTKRPVTAAEQKLPALDITADEFQFKDKQLGKLEMRGVPQGRDWRIEKVRITNSEAAFTAEGSWQNGVARPVTRVNLQLETSDIGKLLTRLGYPEGVRGGTAKLRGTLSWPGGPPDFEYAELSGDLGLQASKGQFVKLEPGIGKLLGILSLQALPRRITLDFRDIFSEGFAFDGVLGAVTINRGIAKTDNFLIQGPPARVLMSGELDLAQETQKLRVKVTPGLSESVSLAAGLLAGPIPAIAAFIAQKILKDPINQLASYEYSVTGTWTDPQVSKIGQQAIDEPEGGD